MDVPTNQETREVSHKTRRYLLLGIAIWFVDLNVSYGLASVACKWGWLSFRIGGLTGLQVVEIVIALVAVALLLVVVYLPWRIWRSYQSEKPIENPHMLHDTEANSSSMAAFIPMAMNSFFALFAVALLVPIFALRACGSG
jgi:hypothetical protein